MPRVRYVGPTESLTVAPAGYPSFAADRGVWVDAPAEVVGRAPKGDDLGIGLLAQGEWDGDKWRPYWERESKTAASGSSEKE